MRQLVRRYSRQRSFGKEISPEYAAIAQMVERVLGKDIRAVSAGVKQVQGVRKTLILRGS
jgi:hypothetical protein